MKLENIQTGDIMLVETNTFLARAIQFFQKLRYGEGGRYNHAGILTVDDSKSQFSVFQRIMVIEAIATGIQRTDFIQEYSKPKYKSIIGLKPKFNISNVDFIKFMQTYVGTTKYDFWDLLGLQPVKMITGKWIGSNIIHYNHFICGQFCAFVYNRLGFTQEMPDVVEIAPIDLFINENFEKYVIK